MSGLKGVAEAYVAEKFRNEVRRTRCGNVKTTVLGKVFASKWEAHRYVELVAMQQHGQIRHLECQRPFAIVINERHVCDYVSDFVYERLEPFASGESWQRVVEDAKGFRTEMYRLKKRLMRACLGIEIVETRRETKRDELPEAPR